MGSGRTWLVMLRDVSDTVHITDEPTVVTCAVLDVDTTLVLGIGVGPSADEACRSAVETAATTRAGGVPFEPGPPTRVLCTAEQVDVVARQLTDVIGADAPAPEQVIPDPEAEDIIDSLVGHLAGRSQPVDPAWPDDWRLLISTARVYTKTEPWTNHTLTDSDLDLVVSIDDESARYVPVVLGRDGIQRGLVLYPGAVLPEALTMWHEGKPASAPEGTLMCYLDPPDDTPALAIGRATRYGWPDGAGLMPYFMAMGPEGPADLSRADARRLTAGMTGILRLDSDASTKATGTIRFDDGRGAFTISVQPRVTDSNPIASALAEARETGDPTALLRLLVGHGPESGLLAGLRPRQRKARRDDVVTFRVRVDIKGAKPPVWRRLELASDLMLDQVHHIVQDAFDWHDVHLHQFGAGPTSFYDLRTERFLAEGEIEDDDATVPETDVRLDEVLAEPGDRLFYLYDFGDDWEHVIKLEAVLPRDDGAPPAVCTTGRQPSPAENCGGVWMHNLIVAAADPSSSRHEEASAELTDLGRVTDLDRIRPIPFDIDEINTALAARFA